MPCRSARRSCKPAKKTSKRVVLYVPDTFDPDIHLPEELRHLADYARYLLHRINVGRVHLRRGNNLVYLKRDYLVKFIPKDRFTAIRDALVESDVIHVRKFCVKGEMSYGYRLLYPHNQGFSLVPADHEEVDQQDRAVEEAGVRHPASPCSSRIEALCQSDHDRRTSGPYLGSRYTVSAGRSGRHDSADQGRGLVHNPRQVRSLPQQPHQPQEDTPSLPAL